MALKTLSGKNLGFKYSTSEQWTGEYYLDGKKIYTKSFIINDIKTDTSIDIQHNIPNIITVFVDNSNSQFFSSDYNYIQPSNSTCSGAYETRLVNIMKANKTNINLFTGLWSWPTFTTNAVVTLRYICTDR